MQQATSATKTLDLPWGRTDFTPLWDLFISEPSPPITIPKAEFRGLQGLPHVINGGTRFETAHSISRKVDDVLADEEMYDAGEPHPPDLLKTRIKQLLQQTEPQLIGHRFPSAEVRPFDGSIRITWDSDDKNVRLVYSELDCYIFHEEVRGGRSYVYEIDRDVTPQSLAKWVNWLNSSSIRRLTPRREFRMPRRSFALARKTHRRTHRF